MDNKSIFLIIRKGYGYFSRLGEKVGVWETELRSIMFNISKIEKETVLPYKKETINNKKIKESEQQEHKNEFDMIMKKDRLQNLILTKSLIVKL